MEYGGNESEAIIEHYGDILYHMGEKENAIKNWQKALELGGYKSKLLQKKIETKTYLE